MKGPLEGIKVVDLSLLLPGPMCSMYLGDMGAEIIKVENPRAADLIRYMSSKIKNGDAEESGMFLAVNRNKKSVTINLKREEGQKILHRLLEDADVLLEGFRPGAMDKMGIGYEALKEKYPKLIYCAISGYGKGGPYENLAGHDGNYISYSGLLGITGTENGQPILPGFQTADIGGGTLVALSSILAALYSREKTGKGQFLDISMMDGAFSFLSLHAGEYMATKEIPEPSKMILNGKLPNYNIYKCKDDKYVMFGALEERFLKSFLRHVNREDLLPLISIEADNIEKLKTELTTIFLQKERSQWEETFQNPDTCLAPVNNLAEALEDPQLQHREMIIKMQHPKLGEISLIGAPFKFSETPCSYRLHPPSHGEHTEEILLSLGFKQDEINSLKEKRAI